MTDNVGYRCTSLRRDSAGLLTIVLPVIVCLGTAVYSSRGLRAEGWVRAPAVAQTGVDRLPPVEGMVTPVPVGNRTAAEGVPTGYVFEAPTTKRQETAPARTDGIPGPDCQPFADPAPVAMPPSGPVDAAMQYDVPVLPCDPCEPCPPGPGWHPIGNRSGGIDWYRFDAVARGYYLNDQRIEWSGVEATFGAEAALLPVFRHKFDAWEMTVQGEFYLNQPFNRNILIDTQERRSYARNFEVDPFEISQLSLAFRRDDLEFVVGKMVTPFGRFYFPLYTNSKMDAPFIRTESIRWRETGVLVRWDPDWLVCEAAVTNGCDDRDPNSSKAIVSRIGIEQEFWAAGVSVKYQDGIGSEGQKEFNNHVGADLMCRWGIFTLSGEVIHDEYGFRRPGFDPDNITWGRSIYYRDLNKAKNVPISGLGYYVNLGFNVERWTGLLNYGEFYPESLGVAPHDVTNRRAIAKLDYAFSPQLEAYGVLILETDGYIAQDDRPRRGSALLTGVQYLF